MRHVYRITKRRALVSAFACAALLLAACAGESDEPGAAEAPSEVEEPDDAEEPEAEEPEEEPEERADWPDTIVYAMSPTEDAETVETQHEPLVEFMTECLDHPFDVFQATSYAATVEAMRTGHVQTARFGPFSYIIAHERAGAEALVQGVRDGAPQYYNAYIISLEQHGIDTLADLEGRSFAFVDPGSTSGHLFPRAHIIDELGVANEDIENWLGDVVFAGGHDAVVISVLNGDVEAGAISSTTWNVAIAEEHDDLDFWSHPNHENLKIVDSSDDIPGSVETVQKDLPQDLKDALRDCYLAAGEHPPVADLLDRYGWEAYTEADDSNFDVIRTTASGLGMDPDELLEE